MWVKSKWIVWVWIAFVSYRCLSDTFCPGIHVTTLDVWEDGRLQTAVLPGLQLTENMVDVPEGSVVESSATSGPSVEEEFRSEAAGRSGGEQTVMLGYKILPAVLRLLCLDSGQVAVLVAKVRATCCDPLLLRPAPALFPLSPVRSQSAFAPSAPPLHSPQTLGDVTVEYSVSSCLFLLVIWRYSPYVVSVDRVISHVLVLCGVQVKTTERTAADSLSNVLRLQDTCDYVNVN